MNVEKFIRNEKTVAVITGAEKVLTDVQSALDLIMTAKYEVGTNLIAIEKSAVADDFFILSRGLAGEMLEKFITYQAKLAIFGDYSHYTSKPLKDFIYESNKGKDVFFVATQDEALERLTRYLSISKIDIRITSVTAGRIKFLCRRFFFFAKPIDKHLCIAYNTYR